MQVQLSLEGEGFACYKPKLKSRRNSGRYERARDANELISMWPGGCAEQFRPMCRNYIYKLFDAGIGYDQIEKRIKDFVYLASQARDPFTPYANTFFKNGDHILYPVTWLPWLGDGMSGPDWKRTLESSGVEL